RLFFSSSSFVCSPTLRVLHSFPTRRSSDLRSISWSRGDHGQLSAVQGIIVSTVLIFFFNFPTNLDVQLRSDRDIAKVEQLVKIRSEEHTSELQSRENLVCRLLLEKKKKTYT